MDNDYSKKLEKEKKKLNRMVDEALEKGTPLSQTQEIMKQCRKIDQMVLKYDGQKTYDSV